MRRRERVVRPDQVRHLIHGQPRHWLPPTWSAAGEVARFFQSQFVKGALRYISDPEGCDLWGPPHATLMRGGGDCDDLAALGVSILHAMGTDADMLVGVVCDRNGCGGHAWIEGHDERVYFVLEATSGDLFRSRPGGYNAQYQLRPGRCLDVREQATKRAALVAVAMRAALGVR